MFKQFIVSLALLGAFGTGSCENRLTDVFEKSVGNYTIELNGYNCQVLKGASKMGIPFEKSLQKSCSQKSYYRKMRVGGIRRFLPEILEGSLNLTKEEILEVVKPLGAAGSVCCAEYCPGLKAEMKAEIQLYSAEIRCKSDTDLQVAVVNFVGDKFTCYCGNEEGGKFRIHQRERASCPISEDEATNYCCIHWQRLAKQCPKIPDWTKYIRW